jgi:hypothetical protein
MTLMLIPPLSRKRLSNPSLRIARTTAYSAVVPLARRISACELDPTNYQVHMYEAYKRFAIG